MVVEAAGITVNDAVRRPVPHALYTAAGAEVCLIVKDHKGEGRRLSILSGPHAEPSPPRMHGSTLPA